MDEGKLLTANEIQDRLLDLPGWSSDGCSITKTFNFTAYMEGVVFANRVADAAEASNHHPDMILGYKKVVVTLTTHSAKGITKKDIDLATELQRFS